MEKSHHTIVLLLLLALMPFAAKGQQDTIVSHSGDITVGNVPSVRAMHQLEDRSTLLDDSIQRWEFHLSMGSSIVGSNRGAASIWGITPSVTLRPSDKLKINASVSLLDSYSMYPNGYNIRGREVRNLDPVRNYGAAAAALKLSASYKLNDRLWLAASLLHASGGLASAALVNPWLPTDLPLLLDATAFTAAMRYRIGDNSFLDIHMTVIDDRAGTLMPLYFGGPFGGFYGDTFYNPMYGHTMSVSGSLF